jgi:hypothetical protein
MKMEAQSMDRDYRIEMSEKLGLIVEDEKDESEDEYVPRSGFSNVLSIQDKMSVHNG